MIKGREKERKGGIKRTRTKGVHGVVIITTESGGAGLSFRPQAAVFVGERPFAFVGVVHDGGRCLRAWARGRVLGARHLHVGVVVIRVVICGCGCCPWGWVVVYGRRVVVHGACPQAVYVVRG